MKILNLSLLVSLVSVLSISSCFGEDNKKLDDSFVNLNATSSEAAKEKHHHNPNSISEKLNASSVNQNAPSHLRANPNGSESKTSDKDYLTEIKDGLNKIFDLCLVIGGIALIFLTLKILYSLSKYIDSLTIRCARKKHTSLKQKDE